MLLPKKEAGRKSRPASFMPGRNTWQEAPAALPGQNRRAGIGEPFVAADGSAGTMRPSKSV